VGGRREERRGKGKKKSQRVVDGVCPGKERTCREPRAQWTRGPTRRLANGTSGANCFFFFFFYCFFSSIFSPYYFILFFSIIITLVSTIPALFKYLNMSNLICNLEYGLQLTL
jgi:hypothetical protein